MPFSSRVEALPNPNAVFEPDGLWVATHTCLEDFY